MTHDNSGNDRQNKTAGDDAGHAVRRFASADEVAQAGAERFVEIIRATLEKNEHCSIVLAGGTTYLKMYALLAEHDDIDWGRVHLFIGDERFVPSADPQSNWGTIAKVLMDHITIPQGNLHPIQTEGLRVEESAERYGQELATFFGSDRTAFDLVLLGIGLDGHTLSIFPGSREAQEPSEHLVITVHDSPKPPAERVSLSYRAVNQARNVLFLVTGAEKKDALEAILHGQEDRVRWPAQGVQLAQGRVEWLTS